MPKQRINFKKSYKLYEACDTNAMRPVMEMVHFLNDAAYASDAHILVRVPLAACTNFDDDDWKKLNGFSVHKKVLKMIMGFDVVQIARDDEAGTCSVKTNVDGFEITFDLKSQRDIHVPNFESVLHPSKEGEPVSKIGLKPSLLYKLSQAVNMDITGLNFEDFHNAIKIENSLDGSVGLIMPVSLSE